MSYINKKLARIVPDSGAMKAIIIYHGRQFRIVCGFSLLFVLLSCEKVLRVEDPFSKVSRDVVFNTDASAVSAITGMYASMLSTRNFASGSNQSITVLASLSSDDLTIFNQDNIEYVQFNRNQLSPNGSYINDLWMSSYQIIYQANSAIASLTNSSALSKSIRDQLLGESLFIRGFTYFNLINMYGNVPAITSIDYQQNTSKPRDDSEAVYEIIQRDLLQAQSLLSENYPSADRVRPNRATATALLSRVYLYRENWSGAETQASLLINNARYALEEDLNNVFLSTSLEAIWQLRPIDPGINTREGQYFILTGASGFFYLTKDLVNSFESGDERHSQWIRSVSDNGTTFSYPFKYKISSGGPGSTPPSPLSEYSMVFRLAEQYLIRAEARAKTGNLAGSIADVDKIRGRAKIPLIQDINSNISKSDLLLAIENERRHELFTEWGHRWFDLKRTKRATVVLGSLKTEWSENDILYPIPAMEFVKNPKLGQQNLGY